MTGLLSENLQSNLPKIEEIENELNQGELAKSPVVLSCNYLLHSPLHQGQGPEELPYGWRGLALLQRTL